MLEHTAGTAEKRAPTNAALAAFQMAIQQERQFQDSLKESVERRKQEAAEAARRATNENVRAEGTDSGNGVDSGSGDGGDIGTGGSGAESGVADDQAGASGQGDRGAHVNIQV